VVASVDRAGDVVARLTLDLDTQLGPTWPCGVELSFGQSWNLKNRLVVAQFPITGQQTILSLPIWHWSPPR